MSNARLRIDRSDDTGDVLAEIRRLVGRGDGSPQAEGQAMVVTARVIAGEEQRSSASQSLALSVELPMAAATHRSRQDGAAGSGNTGTSGDTGPAFRHRQEPDRASSAPQDAPFRLNPDAMIPTTEPPPPASPLRLTPDRGPSDNIEIGGDKGTLALPAGSGRNTGRNQDGSGQPRAKISPWGTDPLPLAPLATEAKAPAAFPLDGPAPLPSRQDSPVPVQDCSGDQPEATPLLQPAVAATTPREPHPPASSNQEPDMQAHANSPVSPLHADAALHLSERPAPGAPGAMAEEDENPLRALLREVVREEFEGELQRSLDDNLRRMVRAEIAAALTEALVRRPRG